MKNLRLALSLWILLSIVGAILKIYHYDYANVFLCLSFAAMIFVIYFLIKRFVR